MILEIQHDILVSGPDFKTCDKHVRLFFEKSQLVHYDSIEIDPSYCINATVSEFSERIQKGEAANREILQELLAKLKEEGLSEVEAIIDLPQGFQSKMLHTISHILDGFFGIDTKFYDIDEISHWITENRREQIARSPETCWVMQVDARSVYGQGFENESD